MTVTGAIFHKIYINKWEKYNLDLVCKIGLYDKIFVRNFPTSCAGFMHKFIIL